MSKMITEKDALPLIPVQTLNEIIDGVSEQSVVLSQFSRLPNMSSRTTEMAVLDSLVDAQFVGTTVDDDLTYGEDSDASFTAEDGVPGLKPTGDAKWAKKKIIAEPIAIVLPISEEVLADADYDIWGELRPRIVEAFGKRIDEAVIWGKGRPASWETGIVPTAIARQNVIAEGTGADFGIDVSNLMGLIEEQGFDPTGFIAEVGTKAKLRNLRAGNGTPLFSNGTMTDPDTLYGHPINYAKNAAFNKTVARLIVGDMKEAKYSIRQDITFKLFTEGVVTNDYGEIVANLMQNDMVALRVVMRLGWVLPNPIHQLNPKREGYPFAVMTK
jgi:HK97 family phage major capsid protein